MILFLLPLAFVVIVIIDILYDRNRCHGRTNCAPPISNPEVSCFVKGLIRSVTETPDQWSRWVDNDGDSDHCLFNCNYVRIHYGVDACGGWPSVYVNEECIELTTTEKQALAPALRSTLYQQTIEEAKTIRAARVERKLAAKLAAQEPFEKLGCP